MKLYYTPGVCASAIHILCTEIGQPVEAIEVDIHHKETFPDDFKKISPLGQVPVLVLDDGTVMTELDAITVYLCDAHPSAFFPAPGATPARATALRWLNFVGATLHPATSTMFMLKKLQQTSGPVFETANGKVAKLWQLVEQHLSANGPFLAGSQPTAGDLYLTIVANWKKGLPDPDAATYGPATRKLLDAISSRPAFQQVMQEEGFSYTALAA